MSIPRDVLSAQLEWAPDLVLAIQGVRRCGKSTLLIQLMTRLQLDPQRCFFMNFEDPRLSDSLDATLLDRLVEFADRKLGPNGPRYFFFDEIQNVAKWEKWLHTQVERPKQRHFAITGSNAELLGGKLGSALTGRHRSLELFPFNLSEFRLARPQATLENYLEKGGFPRTLSTKDAPGLLRQYFTDIIERDVRRHVAARSALSLVQLAKAVFETTGSELSYRKLAKMMDTSADTVGTYIEAFQAAYLVLPCPFFAYSERKRSVRPCKYYPIDLGLRGAVTTATGLDFGKKLETAVFHQLRRRYGRVFFWRDKGEVDFVVSGPEGIVPIQVSWDGPKDRHHKALANFARAHPKARAPRFVTAANFGIELG